MISHTTDSLYDIIPYKKRLGSGNLYSRMILMIMIHSHPAISSISMNRKHSLTSPISQQALPANPEKGVLGFVQNFGKSHLPVTIEYLPADPDTVATVSRARLKKENAHIARRQCR